MVSSWAAFVFDGSHMGERPKADNFPGVNTDFRFFAIFL